VEKNMINEIKEIKKQLGSSLLILAHHYQSDEIVSVADAVGDSLKLAQIAEKNKTAKYIVFCGVHFMAETADILTEENQIVLMPDTKAGCPMADMADLKQAKKAWKKLTNLFGNTIIPITYINSRAEIKCFCGENGGATVTSSNANKIIKWALEQKERILFLPDQNLGRNTSIDLGISEKQIAVYNQLSNEIEYNGDIENIKIILWKGYCHVHHKIDISKINFIRKNYPEMKIIVHPECQHEIVKESDLNGSTEYIINEIKNSPPGSQWAVGTEKNLVNRLINKYNDKKIIILDNTSLCTDMNIIKVENLLSTLKDIISNNSLKQIKVDKNIVDGAKKALNTMLKLS